MRKDEALKKHDWVKHTRNSVYGKRGISKRVRKHAKMKIARGEDK